MRSGYNLTSQISNLKSHKMNNNSFLEGRVYRTFGIFMIFVYAALGVAMLFVWQEFPNHLVVGIILIMWASFRTYMLFRYRARMKNNDINVPN